MASKPLSDPSSDSGIEMSSDTSKSVVSPTRDMGKEVLFPPTYSERQLPQPPTSSDKEIFSPKADLGKEVAGRPQHQRAAGSDTHKVFVPNLLPPGSSQKEVAVPVSDTDKHFLSHSNSTWSTPSAISPTEASTRSSAFRIEKSNSMGLILPVDQKLLVRMIDPDTKLDGGAAMVTNEMNWTDVWAANPPPFELYTAHDFNSSALVARFTPRGWQGFTGMCCEFEVSCQGNRQKWEVIRKGFSRTYQLNGMLTMYGRQFIWKGSTKTVRSIIGDDQKNRGNLKLTTVDGKEILAVWQQWRDGHVLGDLIIFETARDKLAVETILTSCIGVVSAERANGLNWFGGMGK